MNKTFRRHGLIAVGLASGLLASIAPSHAQETPLPDPLAKFVYPMATAIPDGKMPKVTIDVTDSPESAVWAEKAKSVVEVWYPIVWRLLGTEGRTPPETLNLVFKKQQDAPAFAGGNTISVNGAWIAAHPDDLGMMVHELTHLIQRYPQFRNKPGWLVEGIADYIRWWRYEPEGPRPKIDPLKNSYKDSYRVTAYFLAFVSNKYDKGLVPKLDKALRDTTYTDAMWKDLTGKDLDTLWNEFAPKPNP